jgi:segregation and condensation protein B
LSGDDKVQDEENFDDELEASESGSDDEDLEDYPEDELFATESGEEEDTSAKTEQIEEAEGKKSGYSSTESAASLSLMAKIEAIIFASSKCMKPIDVLEALDDEELNLEEIQAQIDLLVESYSVRQGGFRLESVRGHGYQFRTVPEASCYMERLFASRPRPLSRAALETLSIVAYRQPVSRADIEFIRGVDSGSIVKNLLERGVIRCVGRNEEVAGKPMIFGTTDEFLAVFRLNSLNDLPPLSSFQPPQEMLQSAEEQMSDQDEELADGEEPLPEGDFVGVEGEEEPEFSTGVLEDDDTESIDEYDDTEDTVQETSGLETEDEEFALADDISEEDSLEAVDLDDAEEESRLEGAVLAEDDEGTDEESTEPLAADDAEEDEAMIVEDVDIAPEKEPS